jgi:hypothetical protein
MKIRRFSFFIPLLALSLYLSGCATTKESLYIPPSDSAKRSFGPPPPAVIRLPVKLALPKITALPKDLTEWIDREIHKLEEPSRKPQDYRWLISPLLENSGLSGIPKLWDAIQEPIFIDKNIWLLIRPEELSSGLAEAEKGNPLLWNVVLEMIAHPVLSFGEKPTVEKKVLPPLRPYKAGPTGFHAVGNTTISFEEANRILADPQSGLVNYPIKGTGSYRLRVKGVRLYGSGGKVIAQTRIEYYPLINLEGKPSQMTIYFRGVPQYDPAKEVFYLKHLDFDVKTGDFLMQVASWILKSDILNALRKKAHIPIGGKLEQLRERMNEVLTRPVGNHSGLVTQVDSFRILDAFVDRDGIQVQMSLEGTSHLELLSR